MKTVTFRLARIGAFAVLLITLVTGVATAVAGRQAPFRGVAAGSIVSSTPTPSGLEITVHASGTATQLGHYTRVEQLLLDGAASFTGTIVFVAENQDELHVSVSGAFDSPTTAFGQYTVLGGTGRFVGASGTADFQAVTPDGIQMSARFTGILVGG